MPSSKIDTIASSQSPPPNLELQGLCPSSLPIRNQSYSIRKSPKKPVVIYMVSPKVIHAEAGEFMALVQRLTGPSSSSSIVEDGFSDECNGSEKLNRQLPLKVNARTLNRLSSECMKANLNPPIGLQPSSFALRDGNPQAHQCKQSGDVVTYQNWFIDGDWVPES